jgi:hypothetical protein
MDDRTGPPRNAGDILREMAERAKARLPQDRPPVPPPDAPPVPPSHFEKDTIE